MAFCTRCNAELADGAKFCTSCGNVVPTEVACPSCSTVNSAGAKFCTSCGKPVGGAASLTAADQLGDELYARRVSADEIDVSTFKSSLVIRPGSFGVELRDSIVIDLLPAGLQTVDSMMDRLRGLFSNDRKKEVLIVDERPVIVSLSTNVPNQSLRVFLNAQREKDTLSIFVERVVGDKKQLSTIDVERVVKKFLTENFSATNVGDGESLEIQGALRSALKSQFGLAAEFELDRGIPRHHFDLTLGGSDGSDTICKRESCEAIILPGVKFCTLCGEEQDAPSLRAGLASKDGTPVVVDVSIVLEIEDPPIEFALQSPVENILRRLVSEYDHNVLDQGHLSRISSQLQMELGNQLDISQFGRVVSTTVLDVKTVEGDWMLRTRAAMTEAQQELEASRVMLGVEREKVDVQELAKRVVLQRQKMEFDIAFEEDQQTLDDRARRQSIESQHADLDIADAQRSAKRDIAVDETTRERDRAFSVRDREDQIETLEHEMDLESRTTQHDVNLGAIAGEAESVQKRREADDSVYAEKQVQDLKLEKMAGMLDLDERIAKREEEERKAREAHELTSAEQQRKAESEKRDQLRGLTTEQILAMQAGELAEKGQDISSMAGSISGTEAEKEKAELQEKLLREMLDRDQSSREDLKDLAKDAIRGTREAESKTTQAHKTAADQAVSMSEKSMDAMAKVASSAATTSGKAEKKEASTKQATRKVGCVNEACDAKVDEGLEFCGECGFPQGS